MATHRSQKITRRKSLQYLAVGAASAAFVTQLMGRGVAGMIQQAKSPSTAKSWPSFCATPDQRGIAGCTLAEKPELKWEFASPDGWVAAVAIVGEHVYAPALAGYLHCLDVKTGAELVPVAVTATVNACVDRPPRPSLMATTTF